MGIWFADELGVEVEKEVETAVGFGVVDVAGHEDVGGVVVAFGFDEAGVELGEFGIDGGEGLGEDLEFFAASAFDERAADEVIDDLGAAAFADGVHEAADPAAGPGLAERNATFFEEVEDELEVLEFFDGDGVEFFDARIEFAIFFEVEGGGGGFALEMGVIDEDVGQIGDDFRQPIRGNFFAQHQHAS